MTTLLTWPAHLPDALDGLYDEIAGLLAATDVAPLAALTDAVGTTTGAAAGDDRDGDGGRRVLVAVLDAGVAAAGSTGEVVDAVEQLLAATDLDLVLVVGDGHLGTDVPAVGPALAAAAAVAAVRSRSVRRDVRARANVVCVPDALFDRAGTQRGPLAQVVERRDVADAAAFLLGPEAGYLTGQILYVNAGRHLFSSHTA